MDTIRSFWCQMCVQSEVLSRNHKTESAIVFRLLTQAVESSKERNRTVRKTNTQKEKAEKDDSKIEIKLQFLFGVPAHYWHHTAADNHLQYNCV